MTWCQLGREEKKKKKKDLRWTGGFGVSTNVDMVVSFCGLELIGISQG